MEIAHLPDGQTELEDAAKVVIGTNEGQFPEDDPVKGMGDADGIIMLHDFKISHGRIGKGDLIEIFFEMTQGIAALQKRIVGIDGLLVRDLGGQRFVGNDLVIDHNIDIGAIVGAGKDDLSAIVL